MSSNYRNRRDDTAQLVHSLAVVDEIKEPKGTSWFMSSMIIINAALGAGILNFPAAFNKAGGIFPATVIHLVLVVCATASMLILAWCADIGKTVSYQDTIGLLCGRWGRRICAAIIAIYLYGTCITFLIIAGDQSDRLFHDKVGEHFCAHWYMRRGCVVAATSLLLVLPLCYSKSIDFLKYVSLAATAAVGYLVAISVYVYVNSDTTHVHVKTAPTVWTDIPSVIPAICFGYQCHVSVVPIYSCLQPHSFRNFAKAASLAVIVCFLSYSVVGTFGLLTYGDNVDSDLLSSYSTNDTFVFIGFLIFGLKGLLTYPILLFCGRLAIESLWSDVCPKQLDSITSSNRADDPIQSSSSLSGELDSEAVGRSDIPAPSAVGDGDQAPAADVVVSVCADVDGRRQRAAVVTVWFLTTLLVSVTIPDIAVVLDLLGTVASLFIFVFPGVCLMRASVLFSETLSANRQRLLFGVGAFFVVFGVFLFGLMLAQTVQHDIRYGAPKHAKLCRL